MSRLTQWLIGIAVFAVAGLLVVRHLPMAGYDSDVTRIGQGRPAVVLVYENFAPPSMAAMDLFDQVRREYEERVEFLVADTGSPRGQAFIAEHGVQMGQVLTFRGDGILVRADWLAGDAQSLRERLRQDLGLHQPQ
jgi:hypothetical protein